MGQVLIRNVDDATIAFYKERARLKGHSLERELREALTRASALDDDRRGAMLAEFRRRHGQIAVSVNPEDVIRQDREAR